MKVSFSPCGEEKWLPLKDFIYSLKNKSQWERDLIKAFEPSIPTLKAIAETWMGGCWIAYTFH